MPFEAIRGWLPELQSTPTGPGSQTLPPVRLAVFTDDLEPEPGVRLHLRTIIRDRGEGGYIVDLSETTPLHPAWRRFALRPQRIATATVLALAHALELQPTSALLEQVELVPPDPSWVAPDEGDDPAATAMAMARLYDTLTGALGQVWPDRVGAGSCTLGAVVELDDTQHTFTEVLAGGEGARADRAGRDAWPGPILPARTHGSRIETMKRVLEPRPNSGGGGARHGGNGLRCSYRCDHPLTVRLAFDRVDNPPHGIDRAGPPLGTDARIEGPAGSRGVRPWVEERLEPGEQLIVQTCGGAGHGFPGYGDIRWDPSEWF